MHGKTFSIAIGENDKINLRSNGRGSTMPKVNWKSKDDVIAFCERLNDIAHKGNESIVIQYEGRINYNIIHKARRDLWDRSDVKVVWEPSKEGV